MDAQPDNILVFRRGRAELKIRGEEFSFSGDSYYAKAGIDYRRIARDDVSGWPGGPDCWPAKRPRQPATRTVWRGVIQWITSISSSSIWPQFLARGCALRHDGNATDFCDLYTSLLAYYWLLARYSEPYQYRKGGSMSTVKKVVKNKGVERPPACATCGTLMKRRKAKGVRLGAWVKECSCPWQQSAGPWCTITVHHGPVHI